MMELATPGSIHSADREKNYWESNAPRKRRKDQKRIEPLK